ncbi:MAG: glycosyl hydrolase [Fimbriimonas sp.]|nr:glycosyl hydrolase [Fimbriimonas sp.]
MRTLCLVALTMSGLLSANAAGTPIDDLRSSFLQPPAASRPWVYWFWLNGNITKAGITADLEAMKRVGVGGVLIMETDQGAPLGPVPFASPKWRTLFHHVVTEAGRLGLQVNMNDDAGWAGSGGPWITPDKSMQKVVWSEEKVAGAKKTVVVLPKPQAVAGFYRDIAVLAFPTPGAYRIREIEGKAAYVRRDASPVVDYGTAPEDSIIDKSKVVDLTTKMGPDGKVVCNLPEGDWTIMRFGYTSTGSMNEPSPQSGLGLECDKLSKEGSEAAFNGLLGKLVADSGPLVGNALVRMHIDSWEVGSQNWTAHFRDSFRNRRGYDLLPYLPVYSGKVVGSLEVSERFLWDLRQTVSDLLVDNYEGHMAELARQHGIQLSTEAYGDMTMDDLAYAGRSDEPMGEFWTWNGDIGNPQSHSDPSVQEMVSSGHVYGKRIIGAESFTSDDSERWRYYPGLIKAMGDLQFCHGINRYVVHRYALQPWLNVKPGMSMGPWGLHYERTATWWEKSIPWHTYVARCQNMLRQGLPVVDVLYLAPEGAPSSFTPPASSPPSPYHADACPPDALLHRATVKNGRIVFPDGMSYAALVLPSAPMTPRLLRKIKALCDAGAIVVGPKPAKSPSLVDYPACDSEVQHLADLLWVRGRVIAGKPVEQVLAQHGIVPDMRADPRLNMAHRRDGNTDIYFVANTNRFPTNSICTFRVGAKAPEIWNPETGLTAPVPQYTVDHGCVSIPMAFGPADSLFVVFKPVAKSQNAVVRFTRSNADVLPFAKLGRIVITKALWGPKGDASRTKDVQSQVQRMVDGQVTSFQVAQLAGEGDPAVNIVKTLNLEYTMNGRTFTASATDPESISFMERADRKPVARLETTARGLNVVADAPGDYAAHTRTGRTLRARVKAVPTPFPVTGPWTLDFPPGLGAPKHVVLPSLISWSESKSAGVRYFSGTATYHKTFDCPADRIGAKARTVLDLGAVGVIAEVKLNGQNVGLLWRAPYQVDVTGKIRPGKNELTLQVTNLWPNRMIGDESLPEDGDRNPNGTLKSWPKWVLQGGKSPTGRVTFSSWKLWHKQDELLPSGLIGPVVLRTEIVLRLKPMR